MSVVEYGRVVQPLGEDQLGRRAVPESLKPGEYVIVATTLGRTMATGLVQQAERQSVTVKLHSSGVDQVQTFPASLYAFFRVESVESDNLAERVTVDVGSMVSPNPDDSPNRGPLPAGPDREVGHRAVQEIMRFIPDRLYAEQLWSDIGAFGIDRAWKRHAIGQRLPEMAAMQLSMALGQLLPKVDPMEVARDGLKTWYPGSDRPRVRTRVGR